MTIKVAKKIEISTKTFIVQAIKDIMDDPDFGLELTKKTEKRLKQARTGKEKTTPLFEIKEKYY